MDQGPQTKQDEANKEEPVVVDPTPHWVPIVFVIGFAILLIGFFIFGSLIFF